MTYRMLLALGLALAFLQVGFADETHPKGAHLRYQKTYADAMLEARLRNVPIFFSRHKDF
ncbi:MAG: hypothetical protein QNJ98_00650 [Planctomycetota bacterium]|nr:hypothetical protein [Planctomycetota bacterium]